VAVVSPNRERPAGRDCGDRRDGRARSWLPSVVFLLALWMPAVVHGLGRLPEFSATAVQRAPDTEPLKMRIHVGREAVRTETERPRGRVVEILWPERGRRVMLLPERQVYMELPLRSGGLQAILRAGQARDPCAWVAGEARCQDLGLEEVHGRTTRHWRITVPAPDGARTSEHWIDTERGLPLREIFADGTRLELRFVGMEERDGRQTEKWERVRTGPDRRSFRSWQWYDPGLGIAVREEIPGGFVRELTGIRIGPQDPDLFMVPPGYRRVEGPPAGEGPGPATEGHSR